MREPSRRRLSPGARTGCGALPAPAARGCRRGTRRRKGYQGGGFLLFEACPAAGPGACAAGAWGGRGSRARALRPCWMVTLCGMQTTLRATGRPRLRRALRLLGCLGAGSPAPGRRPSARRRRGRWVAEQQDGRLPLSKRRACGWPRVFYAQAPAPASSPSAMCTATASSRGWATSQAQPGASFHLS